MQAALPHTVKPPYEQRAPAGWTTVIITSRETPETVFGAIEALARAAECPLHLDVVVNGNPALANALASSGDARRAAFSPLRWRVWHLSLGDKAHSWNEYVHRLWPGGELTFFIDGYVRVRSDALRALADCVVAQPLAMAAAGVPSGSRGADLMRLEMAREGGLHGNLFALPASTMDALRRRGIRLPLGVYRTDGILRAALAFGLDPARHEWDPKRRIAQAPAASWDVEAKRWWRWSDAHAHWRRLERQAQGTLENRAVSDWLAGRRRPPEGWPETVTRLVSQWAEENPAALTATLGRNPRLRRAWDRLQVPRDWSAAQRPPDLLHDSASAPR